MEIKERKIMTKLIFSEEEGDLLIKIYDVIHKLSYENDICDPDEVFQSLVCEIEDQKKRGYKEYSVEVEDYYE